MLPRQHQPISYSLVTVSMFHVLQHVLFTATLRSLVGILWLSGQYLNTYIEFVDFEKIGTYEVYP